jgi:tRNA (guanine37-N1)-methyltransferase
MQFHILTIFPEFFSGILDHGILRRAILTERVSVHFHDLRVFTHDRHRTVDDRPFGGGEGMVLKPQPIADALTSLNIDPKSERQQSDHVILLSAQGRSFTQSIARQLAATTPAPTPTTRIILICGRYEGVDERINTLYCDHELSIGDYILSGGELAAAIIVDCVTRLLPGVLGNQASGEFESFGPDDSAITTDEAGVPRSQHGSGGLLDYPHFTRPAEFAGLTVPEVLLNGDHLQIRRWRREQQLRKTLLNRPDLLEGAALSAEDLKILAQIRKDPQVNL